MLSGLVIFAALHFGAAISAEHQNLFDNPEFNEPKSVWRVVGKGHTFRCETAPMSGEWIYRTTGNSYNFLSGVPRDYEPRVEYTMEVKARGVGGDATLSILELYRDDDGKVKEGVYAAYKVRLGDSFRIYRFPFVSSKKPLHSFMFYKLDPKTDDGGIDIASIRLYKGKLSTLEFRPLNRIGRKSPVPGTEVPLIENPFGRKRDRLSALAFVSRDRDIREFKEFFNGLNAEVDVLSTTGKDQDIYETDSSAKLVEWRLKKKEYDLFIVPGRAASRIGNILFSSITNSVHSGAGLYILDFREKGHFARLLEDVKCKPPENGLLSRAFPGEVFEGKAVDFNPSILAEGRLGKGRIMVEQSPRGGIFKIMLKMSESGITTFPFSRFADPYLARLLYRTAGKSEYDIKEANKVRWTVVDFCGTERGKGESSDMKAAQEAAMLAPSTSGRHIASFWIEDSLGNVLDYDAVVFNREGPAISGLRAVKGSVDGDDPAVFSATATNAEGCSLVWFLEDFSGRILEIGKTENGKEFQVPVRRLYTNMGLLKVQLRQNGKVKDMRTAAVYARSRDIARTHNDFTPSMWGALYSLSRDTFNQFDRHLEDVGFRASVLPVPQGGFAQTLRNGMALGGGDIGEGAVFRPFGQKGNIRLGGMNTKKGRQSMRRYASSVAKRASPYGVTQYTVTDEPNFTLRYTTDELDENPENIDEYRLRMQRKYSSIEEFNKRHQTDYAAFKDIRPGKLLDARKSGRYAEYIEWRNFNVDRWCEAIKEITDEAKKADPSACVSLANSFGQTSMSANDYWKLLTKTGLGFSNEYTAMVYFGRNAIYNFDELYRSFRPDMRLWGYVGYGMSGCQVRFMPWWFAAHRYGGFTWFSACGKDFRIFDLPSLAYTQDAADIKDSLDKSHLMDGLGKLFLTADWKKRDVAVYYSHNSLHVATLSGKEEKSFEIRGDGPVHDYMYSRQGAQYLIEDLLYQFDFVSSEQVENGILSGYKVLVMPRIKSMSAQEVAAVDKFISAGGYVIADEMPGEYDELGVPRGKTFAPSPHMRIIGENFDDLNKNHRTGMRRFLDAAGSKPVVECAAIEGKFGREAMHFKCGAGDVFVVLRKPNRSKGLEKDSFLLPVKGYVYDSVAGRYAGLTNMVEPEMDEGGAAVFSVLKSKVKGIDVDGIPAVAKRGAEISLKIQLDMTGEKPDTAFNVRFVSPAGECRFHMRRNVFASKGVAHVDFPMAYNDPAGEWKIVVRDAMTGMVVERNFTLK